jgi:hypothetical protein
MKQTIVGIAVWALLGACAFGQALPPASSPGVANPLVTQANLQSTVCVANWTKTVRPPTPFTNRLKLEQMQAEGLTGKPLDYEEDHRWPIEDGGNPTDPRNLWPQLWPEARLKDRLETYEHRQLCAGKITLADVGAIFTGDWWQEYDRLAPVQKWPPRSSVVKGK